MVICRLHPLYTSPVMTSKKVGHVVAPPPCLQTQLVGTCCSSIHQPLLFCCASRNCHIIHMSSLGLPISELSAAADATGGENEDSIPSTLFTNPQRIIFHETQFFPLQTQSNIYGLLSIFVNGTNKLVVSTLRGEIFCLEYHKPSVQRPPTLTPINFNYIPGWYEFL